MATAKRLTLILLVLVACVACDQTTKAYASAHLSLTHTWSFLGDTLRLQLAHNQGAFLGMGASLPVVWRKALLLSGIGVVLLALLGYAVFSRSTSTLMTLSLALVFSGGASNLADRIINGGYVVDFLNIGIGPLRTGIFNVADVAITTGIVILLAGMLRKQGGGT